MEQSSRPTLHLFSTGRALQRFYQDHGEGFLPHARTLEEFLSTIRLLPNQKLLPTHLRPIILSLAASKVEVERLGFPRNFLSFLENSSFFLSFFDELAEANIKLSNIALHDTYDEYGDHLAILEKLYEAYKNELHAHGFVSLEDDSLEWELYEDFIRFFGAIILRLDGFLSAREYALLRRVSELTPLSIHLEVDRYNHDYYERLGICKDCLEAGFLYEIDLVRRAICAQKPLKPLGEIRALEVGSRLEQVGALLEQVSTWLHAGIAPEEIVIILPDEKFSDYLRLFDKARNFNYAMGESPLNAPWKRQLDSLLERDFAEDSLCGLGALYALRDDPICAELSELKELIERAIVLLLPLQNALEQRSQKEMLSLVALLFAQERIDDVGGGRIRVMGILETRGMDFTCAIVVDFNEGAIPKPSDKDLFLNSAIRKHCALPTRLERENLQKHYYFSLFCRTENILLTLVRNEQSEPSRMLHELGIAPQKAHFAHKLFPKARVPKAFLEEIVGSIPYKEERFSHSRLRTFLECKRRYYYHYVRKYSERDDENSARIMGELVHRLLKESFEAAGSRAHVAQEYFAQAMKRESSANATFAFEADLVVRKMERFFALEKKRQESGAIPIMMEERVLFEVEGIAFEGYIDRVDRVGEEYFILDYKLKREVKADTRARLEESSDFQFALYALALRQKFGQKVGIRAFYYDLQRGELIEESLLEEKIELLRARLAELKAEKIVFERCEDTRRCLYCPYVALCDREE
ncbi:MAG: RecB family exonuclease [Wolinella sp.]